MHKELKSYGLYVAALISFSHGAMALSLDEAIQKAISSSPLIEKSASASQEALWKKRETYSGFLPTLSASANHLLSKKYALTNIQFGNPGAEVVVPQIIPSSQFSVSSSFPIFEGFSSIQRYQSMLENESAAQLEFNWNQFKTEMDVTLIFYKTVASKTLIEVAEQNLKVLKDHLKEVNLFKKSGMATNYDVLRVEVQVSNAETELLSAIDNLAINEQNLLELLGENNKEIKLSGTLPVFSESILAGLSDFNFYQRPDIKAQKERISSLSHLDKAQNSYWVPRLSAFGQYQYYNNINDSLTDSEKYRSAYQVGILLTWNLFDGLSSYSKAKQTTEQIVQAEKSYRMTELKAQKEVEIWKRKFNYFLIQYKSRVNDISKSQESVRLAKEGRRVGSRTNTDLLDAEADLYKSQAGAVNAQIGAIEALINLQTSLGKKITVIK